MITAGVQGWEMGVTDIVRKKHPGDQMELGVGSFMAGCPRQVDSPAQAPSMIGVSECHRNNAHSAEGLSFDSIQVLSSVPGRGTPRQRRYLSVLGDGGGWRQKWS